MLAAHGDDTAPVGNDLTVVFPTLYSGYDEGAHVFQVPAEVPGFPGALKWSASDASYVSFNSTVPALGPSAVMITTRKAGT